MVAVPTFEPLSPTSTSAAPAAETGDQLPAECTGLLEPGELSALFGLPVESVVVRTIQGTPSPSVGRLERMTCTYTVPGAAPQGVVLRMTIGAYRDAAAARTQHERNVADERGGTSSTAEPALGTAAATVLERGAGTVLLTAADTVTLDLDLPPRSGPLPSTDLLVDLARRMLARLLPSHADGSVSS